MQGKIVYQGKTEKDFDVVIRYPLKDDVFHMRDYINTLSNEKTFIRFQGEQVSLEDEEKYLISNLEKIEKHEAVQLMVFHGNKLIGLSDVAMQDKIEKHIGIFGITIAKEFRNQGVGKLLINLVLKEAKENIAQLKIVTLGVFANNPVAMEMYKRFGFKEYGNLPKGILYCGNVINHIYMYKNIE